MAYEHAAVATDSATATETDAPVQPTSSRRGLKFAVVAGAAVGAAVVGAAVSFGYEQLSAGVNGLVSAASTGGCAKHFESCSSSKCCEDKDRLCYKKDDHWSSCRHECTPGHLYQWDSPPYNTPWECEFVGGIKHAGEELYKSRTGCSNWRDIMIREVPNVNDNDECYRLCRNTTGCQIAGYQPSDCGDLGKAAKTCYLYEGKCEEVKNTCWDLTFSPGPDPVGPIKPRMGCSNWQDILISEHQFENEVECTNLCVKTKDCRYANYQPADCGNQGKAAQTCYLFKEGCTGKANACWDLFPVDASIAQNFYTTIMSENKAGDCTISVYNYFELKVGQTIGIQFDDGVTWHTTIKAINDHTVTVDPCIPKDTSKGNPVWVVEESTATTTAASVTTTTA